MRRLRFGVLGTASIARRRMLPALLAAPSIELVAIASRSLAKATALASEFTAVPVEGYAHLLARDDIDAVYIPLPTGLHAEWTAAALAAGKHVLSEKAFVPSLAAASALVHQAREADLLLMEGFMFLHHSQHAAVQRMIADGAIGTPRSFSSAFGIPPRPPDDIRYRHDLAGGALLDLGVYPIRAAQLFLGPSLSVAGAVLRHNHGVDVAGAALLSTPDGVTADLSFGFEHGYRNTYAVWGSTGRLSLDRAFTPPDDWRPVVRIESSTGVREVHLPPDRPFVNLAEFFAKTILTRGDYTTPCDDILRQATLVTAIRDHASPTA